MGSDLERSAGEKRERVEATLALGAADRPPVCFWHHFQCRASGRLLGRQSVDFFHRKHDLDIAKIMPDIAYPIPRRSMASLDDWLMVHEWPRGDSYFTSQYVDAVQTVRAGLGPDYPLLVTVYSPLTEALHFAQSTESFLEALQQEPDLIHQVLANLTVNLRVLTQRVVAAGADGVYFSIQGCSSEMMDRQTYLEVGRPYDLAALQGAHGGWLNILHVHGNADVYLDQVRGYPVQVIGWSDRVTGQRLGDLRKLTDKCLTGGWDETLDFTGPFQGGEDESGLRGKLLAQARDALDQVDSRGLILSPGCSVADASSDPALATMRSVAEDLRTTR